jgi:hypothetical protein
MRNHHNCVAVGSSVSFRYNEYVVFHSELTYPEYLLRYQLV